jgi:DNA-binding MarR family transcriptional regulator
MVSVHARLLACLDSELQASSGLSLPDYEVLVHLSEAEGQRMRMSDLAEHLDISPSGLTRRLDGLVAAGLVDRVQCPEDRRGSFAVLTRLGYGRLSEAAPEHAAQVRRHFADRLTRRQLTSLAEAMEALGAGGAGCTSGAREDGGVPGAGEPD